MFLNNSGRCSRICGTSATPKPSANEIAIATNKDMSTEQAKYKALKNRARGKK